MTLLSARSLAASYGQVEVLHGVDVDVVAGAVTAVLGANGAGKTTLLRAICGMVTRRGQVLFDGTRIDRMCTEDIARLGMAHVPEGRGTFASLTTLENLRLGAHSRRDKAEVAADLERIYRYFPRLLERRSQQAGTLSGGEQQMLAMGRALMLRPKVMLLDEPSFGLAPRIVQELYGIVRKIKDEERVSILLVEQNATIALDLADHVCLMETGRIVMAGPPEQLLRDDSLRRAYLGY